MELPEKHTPPPSSFLMTLSGLQDLSDIVDTVSESLHDIQRHLENASDPHLACAQAARQIEMVNFFLIQRFGEESNAPVAPRRRPPRE